ncbi:penicillin-binding protein 2 [Candidatus Falkowbacteria bacterium]|nr:penicillin-binding protein 2 [Candidatus Falkowbacteria bacterium]
MNNAILKRSYKNAKEIDADIIFSNNTCDSALPKEQKKDIGFIGKYLSDKKLSWLLVFILICLFILLGRSFYLQIIKGSYYNYLAESNRSREKPIIASRGIIFDSMGKPLIKNNPIFSALVLPRDLSLNSDKRQEQIMLIAETLNLTPEEINNILDKYPKNFKYAVAVKDNIDYETSLLLKIKSSNIIGLYIEAHNQREYLYPYEFSHLIGYEGKLSEQEFNDKKSGDYLFNDYIGKTGLELSYESTLRGEYGKDVLEVDATGSEKKVIYHKDANNGQNLILTIDEQVQNKARETLNQYLKRLNKKRGSLVILNPQNGEVLALVSLPDFNGNSFALGISVEDYKKLADDENKPLFNRAIKGEYPSGSTIKPVVAAAALQEGIITDKTTVMSKGGLWVYERWFFPDWAAGGHGLTNVYKAIAWSVNTFFYMVGGGFEDFEGLGVENLEKYFKIFGLGEKTGIDLAGEATGLVPNPLWKKQTKNEDWYIGDTYHISIGQGDLLVTPLQIANYTSVFVNGGKLFRPYLVKEIVNNNGEKKIIEPFILRENFIDQKNLDIVKTAMRQTTIDGSAELLNALSFGAGGKTGTAQWSSEKQTHAWFTGFAPYNNPELVITILVEEGGEGSQVCVPVAYDFLNWYFNVYKVGN